MEHAHNHPLPAPTPGQTPAPGFGAQGGRKRPTAGRKDGTPPTFCITTGDREVYGVTLEQAAQLRRALALFIEREKAPAAHPTESHAPADIHIDKCVRLTADNDRFFVEYSLHTFETDMQCMSAGQMRRVALSMLRFLNRHGEDGRGEPRPTAAAAVPHCPKAAAALAIRRDARPSRFASVPVVTKYINQDDDNEAEVTYDFSINEMLSADLTLGGLTALLRLLDDLLTPPGEA